MKLAGAAGSAASVAPKRAFTSASLSVSAWSVPSAASCWAPYAAWITRWSRSCSTTMVPMWPSGAGSTAKSAGVTGCEAQPAARAAATRAAASLPKESCLRTLRDGLVHLHDELGAAHAHDRRGRADLHRLGRLLDHLAGDGGEPPPGERPLELARVGRGVERVLVDREGARGADGDEAVVAEGDAGGAVGAGDDHVRGPHRRPDRRGDALRAALDRDRAVRDLHQPDVGRIGRQIGRAHV